MKKNILIYLAAGLSLLALSCKKESSMVDPYPRNEGEEYINVTPETLSFLGRGGTLNLLVDASYDGKIETSVDWLSFTAREFPGDKRQFTVKVTAPANKSGVDREGVITLSTRTLSKTVSVSQPAYNRPEFTTEIKTAEEFAAFMQNAPYVEENEVVTIENNIDLKGITLPAVEYFNGILDGKENSLLNLKSEHPLFEKINEKAIIRNLVIAASSSFTATPAEGVDTYLAPFVNHCYGVVEHCENDAPILVNGERMMKDYVAGIAAYCYDGATVKSCINKGKISFKPTSAANNIYAGGIVAYSYGDICDNENYGPIACEPASFGGAYFLGGISPRHQTGKLTGNINHKEGLISTNTVKAAKSYIGGIIGFTAGAPVTTANQVYADLDIKLKNSSDNIYIGALQGWQEKVDDASMPDATLFEGSIVNSNIKAYYKASGKYGNNPCGSAGFITGRFSGQSGKATTLHYGNEASPIKVSGSIYCYATDTKVVAAPKDYKALLDGDHSMTSVNGGGIPETDYNTIRYEVVGDGQTGPAEELIVTIDDLKLQVPMDGGQTSFQFKANYDAVVKSHVDWLYLDKNDETAVSKVFPVEEGKQTVDVFAKSNVTTLDREGQISVELPNGSYGSVTILQPGNKSLPAELAVDPEAITADPAGSTESFTVTANYDATVAADCDWITVKTPAVKGDYKANKVEITVAKNNAAGATARTGNVHVTVKDVVKTVVVSQDKFVYVAKEEIATADDFMDFVEYASDPELYVAGKTYKLVADIDLKGKTLKTISTFVAIFDGQGHKIKNWAADAPLFGTNKGGTIQNLVIDSSCSVKFKASNAVASGSNYCLGVICGNCDTGSIIGCTNNAKVELVEFESSKATFIGGITARTGANAVIRGCANNGAISIKPADAVTQNYRIGGVVAGANGSVYDCVNNAPVEFAPTNTLATATYLGGVAAYLAKTKDMTGCVNTAKGTVTFNPANAASITQSHIGGVLAYLDGPVKTADGNSVSDLRNFGDVISTANNELAAVGGLIGYLKSGDATNHILENSVVNCDITGGFASAGSANPTASCGLIVGRVALKSGADNVTGVIGTEEVPVKVAGSIKLVGGAAATATADNFKDLTHGAALVTKYESSSAKLGINAKFEAVGKE